MKDFRLLDDIVREAYRSRDIVLERIDDTTLLLRPIMVNNKAITISFDEGGLTVGYAIKKDERSFVIPIEIKDLPEFRDSISLFAYLIILLLDELVGYEEGDKNES